MRADLVVWRPAADLYVQPGGLLHRHKRTPYEGLQLQGRVLETYVSGDLVYREHAG